MKGIMRGSGTEDNPHLVEDVFDFCAIKNDEGKEITYYQLVNNIDFNDHPTYKNGISTCDIVVGDKSILNGNDKEIRNIVFYNADHVGPSFTFKNIHHCKFENLVNACTNIDQTAFKADLDYCSAYILYQNGIFHTSFMGTVTNSTFNIAGVSNAEMNFGGLILARCHINFDNYITQIHGESGIGYYIMYLPHLDHVYFTGKLHCSNADGWGLNLVHTPRFINNIYYCVETTMVNNTLPFYPDTANAVSFYSKDLIKTTGGKSNGTNFYALSDVDCKDPSALLNIGFPVIGGVIA